MFIHLVFWFCCWLFSICYLPSAIQHGARDVPARSSYLLSVSRSRQRPFPFTFLLLVRLHDRIQRPFPRVAGVHVEQVLVVFLVRDRPLIPERMLVQLDAPARRHAALVAKPFPQLPMDPPVVLAR